MSTILRQRTRSANVDRPTLALARCEISNAAMADVGLRTLPCRAAKAQDRPMTTSLSRGLLLAASVLALAVPSAHAAVFGPAQDYASGGLGGPGWNETPIAVADFDLDGREDVVSADYFNYFTFTPGPLLQRNLGGGVLQSPGTRVFTGFNPAAFAAGDVAADDLNGDGKPDLVVTNVSSMNVLIGNGNGTFKAPVGYSVIQGGQEDVQLADVNHDGKLDVIVLLRYGVRTFFNDGTGKFPTGVTATFGTFAMSGIEAADFDGDGGVDLAATDAATQQIRALRGDGAGHFMQFATVTSVFVPGTVLAGDFNEDGRSDVAATNEFNGGVNNLVVALNNGAGGFAAPQAYPGGFGPVSGAVGDANADGNLDILSTDTITSTVLILLGNGAGGFSDGGSYPVAIFPQGGVLADLSGDGKPEAISGGALKTGYSGTPGATQVSVLPNIS
jgi:hypothetical protein